MTETQFVIANESQLCLEHDFEYHSLLLIYLSLRRAMYDPLCVLGSTGAEQGILLPYQWAITWPSANSRIALE